MPLHYIRVAVEDTVHIWNVSLISEGQQFQQYQHNQWNE